MLRFGIAGAGMIAQYGFDGITASGAAEVAAIADPHQGRAQEFARRNGVRYVRADAQELFQDTSLDAVYIATPTAFHAPYAIAALRAGKHVILEKPFAFTYADARAVTDAAAKSGKVFMVGMNYRFEKGAQQVRALAERGYFGDIHRIRAFWRRRSGSPRLGTWFGNRKLAGGGCFMDIGVHMIDLAFWTSMNFEVAGVSAPCIPSSAAAASGKEAGGRQRRRASRSTSRTAHPPFFSMRNGATIQLEISWSAHQKDDDAHDVELFGTEAGARVFPLEIYRADKDLSAPVDITRVGIPLSYPHCNRFVNFVRSVLGEERPCVAPEQSLAVQRVIDAAYQSAASGREVFLACAEEIKSR